MKSDNNSPYLKSHSGAFNSKTLGVAALTTSIDWVTRAFNVQKKLGFNIVQWANILGVEHKTLYNWKRSPNTQIQKRDQDQIETLEAFLAFIDKEHVKYISKLVFGRYAIAPFSDSFRHSSDDISALEQLYDEYYTQIDGFVARKQRAQRSGVA